MKRRIVALVLIVVGLAGFFWEVTLTRGEHYRLADTFYGSKMDVHGYDKIKEMGHDCGMTTRVQADSIEQVLESLLSGTPYTGALYFAIREPIVRFRGMDELMLPDLPEGCTFNNRYGIGWNDQGFSFDFHGDLHGYIYVCDRFSEKLWRQSYDNCEYRRVGSLKVYELDNSMVIEGRENGSSFYAILDRQAQNITDEQIAQFGLKRYVSTNPKVLLAYGIHSVRLCALAITVSGVLLLVCELCQRREETAKR